MEKNHRPAKSEDEITSLSADRKNRTDLKAHKSEESQANLRLKPKSGGEKKVVSRISESDTLPNNDIIAPKVSATKVGLAESSQSDTVETNGIPDSTNWTIIRHLKLANTFAESVRNEPPAEKKPSPQESAEQTATSPESGTNKLYPVSMTHSPEMVEENEVSLNPKSHLYISEKPQSILRPDIPKTDAFNVSIGSISVMIENSTPKPAKTSTPKPSQRAPDKENLSNRISRHHIRIK
jgi:hypothetical protein